MPPALRRPALVALHALVWAALMALRSADSIARVVGLEAEAATAADWRAILQWTLLIAAVYVNHFALVPRLLSSGRRLAFLATTLVLMIATLATPRAILPPTPDERPRLRRPPRERPGDLLRPERPQRRERLGDALRQFRFVGLVNYTLLYLACVLGSIGYHARERLRENEALRLRGELARLRGQIQPHFLFNTLNSIYALAVRGDPGTADAIVTLSQFLRYLTEAPDADRVDLARELAYLDDYLTLQRARLRETAQIDYEVSGDPAGVRIAPLLLFTFVENAFAHGVSPEEPSPIDIHVGIERGGGSGTDAAVPATVTLRVANRVVVRRAEGAAAERSSTGLANARRRLELVYPGRYRLDVAREGDTFAVTLVLETASS